MDNLEFQKFLTEQKEYQGKVYSNAQLIALQVFQQVHKSDLSQIEPLTSEQEEYYTKIILGEFIESNLKGNYRLTDETKKCLSSLEKTLKTEYGLSDAQIKEYWSYLMKERAKLEEYYMSKVDAFYHLSPVAPDKIHPCDGTGKPGIDLKECLDAYHQMNGRFCYVAPKGVIPLCLRPTENKMYPYLNPSFVVVCTKGKDFEASCFTCYEYEVERSSAIRPVIMPWGNEPVEYISTRPLQITNLEKPKIQTPQTLAEDGLKIYLIDDFEYYKKLTTSQAINSLPIEKQENFFSELAKNSPDKVRLYTPSKDKEQERLNLTLQESQKQHYTLPTGKEITLSGSPEFVQDVKKMLDILVHSPTALKILDHVALPIEEFKEALDLGRNTGETIQLTHQKLKSGEKIQKYSCLTLIHHEFRHSYNAPKSNSHILNAMAYALVNEGDAQAIEGLVALELNEYIEKNKDKLSDAQAIQDCLAGDPKLQFFKKLYDEAKGSDGERKAHAMEMFVKKFAQHPIQGGKTFAELAYKSSLERNTTVGSGWERFSDEDTQKIEGCLLGKINPESIAHETCMKGRKQLSDERRIIQEEIPTFCKRIIDGTFNTDVIRYGQGIKPISLIDTLSPQLAKHLREIGVIPDISKYAGKNFEK